MSGWKLVPVEPTPEMIAAMARAWQLAVERDDPNECVAEYRAALAAAPSAPAGQAEGQKITPENPVECTTCGALVVGVVQQAPVQPAGAATANECIRCGRPLSSDDFHTCDACATPQPAAQSGGDWRIDASAGSEILVYKNCSVIEGEQAHWVLGLIKAAPPAQSAVTDEQIEAIGAKIYGTCFTPADRQFAREVLALASSARRPLTNNQIRKWWALDNGLEDCDMCKFDDFQAVVRAVEAKHGIAATQAERPAGEEKP